MFEYTEEQKSKIDQANNKAQEKLKAEHEAAMKEIWEDGDQKESSKMQEYELEIKRLNLELKEVEYNLLLKSREFVELQNKFSELDSKHGHRMRERENLVMTNGVQKQQIEELGSRLRTIEDAFQNLISSIPQLGLQAVIELLTVEEPYAGYWQPRQFNAVKEKLGL